jgi:hypothetical protein
MSAVAMDAVEFDPIIDRTPYSTGSDELTVPVSRLTMMISLSGSSFSSGRRLACTPTRKGMGAQAYDRSERGRTGTKMCCQVSGYIRPTAAWMHWERFSSSFETTTILRSHRRALTNARSCEAGSLDTN